MGEGRDKEIGSKEQEVIEKESKYLKREELLRRHPKLKRPSEAQRFRSSRRYHKFRKRVMKREGGICQECGKSATAVHHIIPLDIAPELALDDDNGMALCLDCHRGKHPELPDFLFERRRKRRG